MSGERALHSELAYCGDSPGIMTLLCVRGGGAEKERAGGDMVLVDGLMLARRLEEVAKISPCCPSSLGSILRSKSLDCR